MLKLNVYKTWAWYLNDYELKVRSLLFSVILPYGQDDSIIFREHLVPTVLRNGIHLRSTVIHLTKRSNLTKNRCKNIMAYLPNPNSIF